MIETPAAAARAAEIAAESDFLSIGTNDLVQYTLGLDRDRRSPPPRPPAEPIVLGLVAQSSRPRTRPGKTVEVCGEAAGEAAIATLLIGLGVDEPEDSLPLAWTSCARRRRPRSPTPRTRRGGTRGVVGARALALAERLLSAELRHEARQVVGGFGGAVT